jgi:FAD/FMN-containing dehydrogenase
MNTSSDTSLPAQGRPGPAGSPDLRALLGHLCGGRVHLPGDAGYDAGRTPWNLVVDQRPAAVALPSSAEEVVDLVRAVAAAGLRIVPQSTGHGAAPLADVDLGDAVLVRLDELTGVVVDPERRTARVLGGTQWQQVVQAAAEHGLAALHGSAPDVAVAGYVLGGGFSFYGRKHGLAAHSVRSVEIVTADGRLVHADAEDNRDLWWAVRGGGGNLGIVVALEIELLPFADCFAGMLLWDASRAAEVLPAWVEWTRTAPEEATTSLRMMSFPPLPELPPFLSGRQLVIIDGAVLTDDDAASQLLAPLRALDPEMDTFARIPATGLPAVHMDPPGPVPAISRHAVLGELDDGAVQAYLGAAPGPGSALMFAELRHLGGAFARTGEGALSQVDGSYALFCVGAAPAPDVAAIAVREADAVVAALTPWHQGRRLLNFTDEHVDVASAYAPDAWERLRRVRATVDPEQRMVANHPVR